MANSLFKRFQTFNPNNWIKRKDFVHPEKEFHEILDRERDRADRYNGVFSIVSFNVQKYDGNNDVSQELVKTIISRKLRKVDDIGWCCSFHISVMLHNTGTVGARCYAKGICDLLDNKNNDIEFSVYTYPDDFKNYYCGKNKTKHFRSTDATDGSKKDWLGKTLFSKQTEDKNLELTQFISSDIAEMCSYKIPIVKDFFTKKTPVWKRVIDIVGSAVLIILFSPIMFATAVAIKLTSKGPVIFKQQRAGVGGAPFTFYKFRSMVTDAEEKKKELLKHNLRTGPVFKMENDPRVILVGRIIRKWSLDELPQFFNVLKGDMSLVGPRPPTMDEVPEYINWHNRRLEIKPGITCIWQICARHNKCFENWVRLDIEYARSQSFLLDLKILLLTLPAVISQKGAQ